MKRLSSLDTPNTQNNDLPAQANQTDGKGFFTAPGRRANGEYTRDDSSTFADHWSQPRLFYNSLTPEEQQQLINGIRFETSNVKSETVRNNIITQLNKINNDIAARVATALGMTVPEPDPKYYHDNKTADVRMLGDPLKTIKGQKVGVFASVANKESMEQAKQLKEKFAEEGVQVIVIAERLGDGVDVPYTSVRATAFDGAVVTEGAKKLFDPRIVSALYPNRRPAQTLEDAYRWGKPIAAMGSAASVYENTMVADGPGVYAVNDTSSVVESLKEGLKQFKFSNRFPMDDPDQQGAYGRKDKD
jgi:catalase